MSPHGTAPTPAPGSASRWGDARSANILTNPAIDPISRMPEFKVCAARISRVAVGAGAAPGGAA